MDCAAAGRADFGNGTNVVRLQRLHLSSRPIATQRASNAPHGQRSMRLASAWSFKWHSQPISVWEASGAPAETSRAFWLICDTYLSSVPPIHGMAYAAP